MADAKVTLVRVKRKRNDESVDAFWLEQSPSKRQELEFKNLSLNEKSQSSTAAKLLFRRLETIQAADIGNVSLSKTLLEKIEKKGGKQEARRNDFKRQNRTESTSRDHHKVASQAARYKQVWQRRKEDAMHNHFHLYDVVREEDDNERDMEMLQKFMPLLKECMPEEYDRIRSKDEFVYDVYAQEQDEYEYEDGKDEFLSTVRVSNDMYPDYGLEKDKDSDYDSEDSNREDHPDNDYPDEEEEDEEAEEAEEDEDDEEETDEGDEENNKKGSDDDNGDDGDDGFDMDDDDDDDDDDEDEHADFNKWKMRK